DCGRTEAVARRLPGTLRVNESRRGSRRTGAASVNRDDERGLKLGEAVERGARPLVGLKYARALLAPEVGQLRQHDPALDLFARERGERRRVLHVNEDHARVRQRYRPVRAPEREAAEARRETHLAAVNLDRARPR